MIAVALLLACAATAPTEPPPDPARARLVAALRAKVPLEPVALAGDPYEAWRGREPPRPAPGAVCGVRFDPDGVRYRLGGFPSEAAAREAGFAPTHAGACGTCSTLQDLAVYLERPDLTSPVRRCGIRPTASGAVACLERLGFAPPAHGPGTGTPGTPAASACGCA